MHLHHLAVVALGVCGLACGRDLTVQTLSTREGSPVPGAGVKVDDGAWAMTDDTGQAWFHGVQDSSALHVLSSGEDPSHGFEAVQILQVPGEETLVVPLDAWPVAGEAVGLPTPPPPVELVEPSPEEILSPATVFSWTRGPAGGEYTFFLRCSWTDAKGVSRSARLQAELPEPRISLRAIDEWRVGPLTPSSPLAQCAWGVVWRPSGLHPFSAWTESQPSDIRYSTTALRPAYFQ